MDSPASPTYLPLLGGGPARHHAGLRPRDAVTAHDRHGGRAVRLRARRRAGDRVRAVARAGARRAELALEHRHAARGARAPDAVQGQGAAPGERARGAPELSRSPGGRRPPVRSNPRARGRRPAPAPRADARDRPPLEQPFRGWLRLSGAPGVALDGQAGARARRSGQDVEEPRQHDRPIRVTRDDLGEAQARRHRSGARHPQGPGQSGRLQHLHDPPGFLPTRHDQAGGAQLPHGGVGLSRLQAGAGGQYDSRADAHPRAGRGAAGGAAPGERPAAGRGGPGGRPRAPPAGSSAAPHGVSRRGGRLMQHVVAGVIQMFRLELFLQLCLATLFGGAIGLERELGGKPAGLRTNLLICIGSVLYSKLSVTMAAGNADPTRIAAQIVTGGGFIGAGTILHARGAVVGLTSAATIWVVAAIGVALGAAFYWEAAGTTLLVLVVLRGLGRVERLVARQSTQSTLLVHARPEPAALDELETVVRRTGLEIERQASRRENVDLVIEFTLRGPKRLHDEVMIALLHHPGVRTVSTGE